jgi:hypothetical protein
VRILALLAVAALAACGSETVNTTPGPLDRFFYPTGIAVLDHRIFVASSNADLTYSEDTGGSVISVDPDATPIKVTGALNVRSFAGEIAIADGAACPAFTDLDASAPARVFVPIRGADVVYRLDVGAAGELTCKGGTSSASACEIPVGNTNRGDPWAVGIACDPADTPGGPTIARAYVGYLRETNSAAWITQIDLTREKNDPEGRYLQHQNYGAGQIRGMAYDPTRHRVYFTRTVVGTSSTLAWLDLANDCRIDLTFADGGCHEGATAAPAMPYGLELRGIALGRIDPASRVRRAYVTARVYDPASSASAGTRVGDFNGLLLVVDLVENAAGSMDFQVVSKLSIGYGAAGVRVLPPRTDPVTGLPMGDLVVALAADDGVLWVYDDETGASVAIGRDLASGAPLTGNGPFAMAVDPGVGTDGSVRVYVGSFREHFLTPIVVPLQDPQAAHVERTGPNPTDPIRRISGGVTP